MNKPLTEKQLTEQIRYVLRLHGIFHWKQWQGEFSTPGISDILGIQRGTGKMIAIEIKTDRGKLTTPQKNFIDWVNDAGGIAFVARSVDDVMEKLSLRKG